MRCAVCDAGAARSYRSVDGVGYFRCDACGSLFADPDFLAHVEAGGVSGYSEDYWRNELGAARDRCFGPALLRVAETIAYCRVPIRGFIDIGAGTGWLLDALEVLLPEVIEHLTPATLRALVVQLAAASHPGSLYLFNSGQPDFVEQEDPGYLDPHGRGHVVSYSLAGAATIFEPAGFKVIGLPGRTWAFLAEFKSQWPGDSEALITRLWHPVAENVTMLRSARFGELMRAAALDTARAYLPRHAPAVVVPEEGYLRRTMRATMDGLRRQR
jgi:hypothetical protein